MAKLEDYLNENIDTIVVDVEKMETLSESDLYATIGNALEEDGLSVSQPDSQFIVELIKPKLNISNNHTQKANIADIAEKLRNVNFGSAKGHNQATINKGKSFAERLKKSFCTEPDLVKLFTEKGTLKNRLVIAIPILAGILGVPVLSPWLIILIAATIALIGKKGFMVYCEGYLPAQRQ
jgi:hypothetical protein